MKGFGTDEKANDYMKKVIGAAFSAYTLEGTHTDHQLQQKDTNINLGMPDILAKSTSMTVINGDKIMHGSFMANAKGISYDQLIY